jgi:uncharacterized membrane protein
VTHWHFLGAFALAFGLIWIITRSKKATGKVATLVILLVFAVAFYGFSLLLPHLFRG